jgi:hypothetical protein
VTVLYAFDAGAVLAVLDNDVDLARLLYDVSAQHLRILLPVTCLLEAAMAIDAVGQPRNRLLTLLRAPVLQVTPTERIGDHDLLAATADRLGSEALAHVGVAALTYRCRLFTTRAADLWPLGLADWQVMPL